MNKYSTLSPLERQDIADNYLVDSWSYSKVATFSRNEKEFEKTEIYRERGRRSPTSIAGNAYHKALELFFCNMQEKKETSITEMQKAAYDYLYEVPANDWKLMKTCPTMEEAKLAAVDKTNALIQNFCDNQELYTSELAEVIGVELRCEEFLVINGVDIPLPCHGSIDLVIRQKDGSVVIIDHKSKSAFTDDKELALTSGKQAVTYIKCLESKMGLKASEVWFVENKYSKNKDKSPQLKKLRIQVDEDTMRLYESMLYEPLRRMLEATSNPDYVYMVNDKDNLSDPAELYDFWCRTMVAEISDFKYINPTKKNLISQRLKKIKDSSVEFVTPKTITEFKKNAATFIAYDYSTLNMTNSEKIEHVLRSFGIIVKVAHEIDGYSSNTYLLNVSAGVKIANIMKYSLDMANVLDVPSIRIGKELMVYEGKSYLYIEVAKKREKTLLFDGSLVKYGDSRIPLGMDNFGQIVYWDMRNNSTPHMLICGATGSGKSVSIISTLEYARLAGVKDIIIFDPKYEFCSYEGTGIEVHNEIEDIEERMRTLVVEMQERAKTRACISTLIIFDEFADAVASARSGKALDVYREDKEETINARGEPTVKKKKVLDHTEKSLEENLKMILQKGRSLGYRVIAATQRASTQVITGDAKVNFPVQVCFRVPKMVDSKVVLDEEGAETLAGSGDGLIKSPEYLSMIRFQAYYKP